MSQLMHHCIFTVLLTTRGQFMLQCVARSWTYAFLGAVRLCLDDVSHELGQRQQLTHEVHALTLLLADLALQATSSRSISASTQTTGLSVRHKLPLGLTSEVRTLSLRTSAWCVLLSGRPSGSSGTSVPCSRIDSMPSTTMNSSALLPSST